MSLNDSRVNMIKQQLRTNNIHQDEIISLFEKFSRAEFVPSTSKAFAYADTHLPLDHDQVMLTPLEEAKIVQSGKFKPHHSVLEIGCGTGFMTALLSQVCDKVVAIDYHPDFIKLSEAHLAKYNIKNVHLEHRDGTHLHDLKEHFDAIICTSAIESIPQDWIKYLHPKGKIFAPIGLDKIQNAQWIFFDHGKVQGHEFVFSSNLPAMIDPARREHFKF
jgi:protein-L-isoaspartate(D-aspartate) O-methyltransferase